MGSASRYQFDDFRFDFYYTPTLKLKRETEGFGDFLEFRLGKKRIDIGNKAKTPACLIPRFRYLARRELVVADEYETGEWRKIGVRKLMRATKLTQKAIYSILSGKGVRQQTMHVFRSGLASLEI